MGAAGSDHNRTNSCIDRFGALHVKTESTIDNAENADKRDHLPKESTVNNSMLASSGFSHPLSPRDQEWPE